MYKIYCLLITLLFTLSACDREETSEPTQNTVDISWAPVDRTTSAIALEEEETLNFESSSVELDFYRNTAYTCGFSGNYTFLVVDPMNDPGAEAPMGLPSWWRSWVF